jgi:hypothetical protein
VHQDMLSLRAERGTRAYFEQGTLGTSLVECQRLSRECDWLHPRYHLTTVQFTARWSYVRTIVDREERHRVEDSEHNNAHNTHKHRLVRVQHAEVRPIAEAKVQWYAFVAWFLDCASECPSEIPGL